MLARVAITLAFTAVVLASGSRARADVAPEPPEPAEHAEPAEPHHANHIAIFAGATTELAGDNPTHLTIGADYERRLPFADRRFGVGALIDSSFGDDVETLIAPFVSIHPGGGLILLGAIGVAMTGFGDTTNLALRGGAAYFVEVGDFAVGPAVSVDYIDSTTAIVFGASLGHGF